MVHSHFTLCLRALDYIKTAFPTLVIRPLDEKSMVLTITRSRLLAHMWSGHKIRDHEIRRAQKKVSKGRPNTPSTSCNVVTGPSSVVWSHMWPGTRPTVLSKNFYSCESSHMIIHRINQQLWAFGVPWSPGFVLGLLSRGGFWKIVGVTMKHDPFDAMWEFS